jgi:serine protease Do
VTPADDALRAHLGLPKDQGLTVTSLAAHAPAAQAGIQQNDVLLKLGDLSLARAEDLDEGLKGAGDKPVSLTILRGGKTLTIKVQPRVRVTMGPVQAEPPAFWIGVSVSPLEPALRSQLKLPQNQGLLAIDVIKDSPAAKSEVKVHDILISLGGKALDSQDALVKIVQANGEKPIRLEVIREGKPQTIELTPQRRKPAQLRVFENSPFYYQFVRPGAMISTDRDGRWVAEVTSLPAEKTETESPNFDQKSPMNATGASKRLDELDAEIKQLRKAIEELNKTLKDKK